jgi:ABC-2 type transport system ATP-binding protein
MIAVEAVTRKYGSFTAVDAVSFTAQAGRVTGFLGPNGAGKSTTMRILVGLTRATSGTATVSGRQYVDLPNPGLEVGVLLDASAQHAGRTGREILTIAQQYLGLPKRRVEEMLEVVSLTPTESSRRVGNYSLGMRQRLGIATALIGDPQVLILDEPANGLDPAGIRWMRDLLRGYADRGGTVLLSSHLLHEIEVIADDIVMIGNGRIVSQGTKDELLHAAGTHVRAANLGELELALIAAGLTATPVGNGALSTDADATLVGQIALEARIALTELRPAESSGLEEMFLELTAESQREDPASHEAEVVPS